MANVPGAPALQPRIFAPGQVEFAQVAPFAGFAARPRAREAQPVRPFGGALQLRNGVLVIPNQYEIVDENRDQSVVSRVRANLTRMRDRLTERRLNVTGVLTGDIFDSNIFGLQTLNANENQVLITINGIFNAPEHEQILLNSINTFGAIPRFAVRNGTHGILGGMDIVQIAVNTLGWETISDLRAAAQIEIAAQALRNNGGQGPKIINVVAHSQGTEVFFRALNFLRPETKAMIRFIGLGGQRFVPNDIGLGSAVNYYYGADAIPHGANMNISRRFYARDHQYTVYRMPGGAHAWTNHAPLFAHVNQITVPPGTRAMRYGGNFPFSDIRFGD